jgi:hypothetical protein
MRKIITILLAAAVGTAFLIPAADAGSKTRSFFLRWDDDGAGGCGPFYLSTKDLPDSAGTCWYTFQPAQEVLTAAGMQLVREWSTTDGVPFTMGAGDLHGEITMNARVSAGTTLDLEVRSNLGTIATESLSFSTTPVGPTQTLEFDVSIPKKMIGKKVTGVTLSTTVRGVMVTGWIELDNPPSFITFPIR